MSKICEACPFNCSEASAVASNLGCLPTGYEVLEMHKKENKIWMCHSNEDRVCQGLKETYKETFGEGLKVNGKIVQTYSAWYHGEKE